MIVSSAGDTGTNSRVDLFVGIIQDLARKHGLARFHVGYFYSEMNKDALLRRIIAGDTIMGLDARPPLDPATLDATGRVPTSELRAKLEGAGKVGERYVGIVGVRDPYTIANIDLATAWVRQQVVERFGDSGYELHFTIHRRDAILGDKEPLRAAPAHEVGIGFREPPTIECLLIPTVRLYSVDRWPAAWPAVSCRVRRALLTCI